MAIRRPSARRRRPRRAWENLSDRELLQLRFRDLGLSLSGTWLEPHIHGLYEELARAGLKFRPHCWLAEEWFSPDGIPGIAIPFYLAHPRLMRLERRMMREVEGGNARALLSLLRHEAGHALDSAFRLRRRRGWRAVFGSPSRPYGDFYRPRPGSRRFVQHLDAWYAQSHPTEDFAETFAVWLKPGRQWRRIYRNWPALAKLQYVDRLMDDLKGRAPPVRSRRNVEPMRADGRTLAEYYRTKLKRYAPMRAHVMDHLIHQVFANFATSARTPRAATLLRSFRAGELRKLATQLQVSQYLVRQAMHLVVRRCEVLDLYVRGPVSAARRRARALIKRVTRLQASGRAGRHSR